MDVVQDKVSDALDAVAPYYTVAADKVTELSSQLPLEGASGYYALVFGDMPLPVFAKEWVPLLYVSLMPLLCIMCICCCSGSSRKKTGERVMRRVHIAVRADVRMLAASGSAKKVGKKGEYVGVTSLSDVEKGKGGSPLKNKKSDEQLEKKIKEGAKKKPEANPRRY